MCALSLAIDRALLTSEQVEGQAVRGGCSRGPFFEEEGPESGRQAPFRALGFLGHGELLRRPRVRPGRHAAVTGNRLGTKTLRTNPIKKNGTFSDKAHVGNTMTVTRLEP